MWIGVLESVLLNINNKVPIAARSSLMKTAIFYPIYMGKIALLLHEVDRLSIKPTTQPVRLKRHLKTPKHHIKGKVTKSTKNTKNSKK